jgi:hypothetical protein
MLMDRPEETPASDEKKRTPNRSRKRNHPQAAQEVVRTSFGNRQAVISIVHYALTGKGFFGLP